MGPATAADQNAENVHLRELKREILEISDESILQARAFGSINVSISANSNKAARKDLSLSAGESVTIDCSYSPVTASVDFGLVAPDGYFYYERVTGGSIDKTITVDEYGSYTFVIRNNSSDTVQVIGTIKY